MLSWRRRRVRLVHYSCPIYESRRFVGVDVDVVPSALGCAQILLHPHVSPLPLVRRLGFIVRVPYSVSCASLGLMPPHQPVLLGSAPLARMDLVVYKSDPSVARRRSVARVRFLGCLALWSSARVLSLLGFRLALSSCQFCPLYCLRRPSYVGACALLKPLLRYAVLFRSRNSQRSASPCSYAAVRRWLCTELLTSVQKPPPLAFCRASTVCVSVLWSVCRIPCVPCSASSLVSSFLWILSRCPRSFPVL